jgi:hypothetical protein
VAQVVAQHRGARCGGGVWRSAAVCELAPDRESVFCLECHFCLCLPSSLLRHTHNTATRTHSHGNPISMIARRSEDGTRTHGGAAQRTTTTARPQ